MRQTGSLRQSTAPCPEGCRRESIMTLDDVPGRSAYDADHEAFRETVRSFLAREGVPNVAEWAANRLVPKEFWRKAGAIGRLCPTAPEAHGGAGPDSGYTATVAEEHKNARG